MLKRTISGAVLAVISAAVIIAYRYTPIFLIAYFALCAGIGTYEMLHNTGIVKKTFIAVGCSLFSAAELCLLITKPRYALFLVFIYAFIIAVVSLRYNQDINLTEIASELSFPMIFAVGFTCTYTVFGKYGLAFLLLLLNFSAVCDIFAYLVGSTMGKHKLCSQISPKKTVEGAVGGVVGSILVTFVVSYIFKITGLNLVLLLILTPFMCAVGMVGDLFASVLKRKAGIKDYGAIIPGHGGILDRFDSILLISPVFLMLLEVLM